MNQQSKSWCFTLNNYDESHELALSELGESSQVDYLIYGREVGESGTPHLQGYVVFSVRKRGNQVKSCLPGNPHLERANGSPAQNKSYCSKEGDCVEFGDCPGGQGSRSDLAALQGRLQEGANMQEISSEFFTQFIRYGTGIQKFYFLQQKPRKWKSQVIVYYGDTGTGKTRSVHEQHEGLYVHSGGRWFDGYDGHEVALFDDYGGSEFKLTYLLKLLDRYECKVEVKGGMRQWIPKKIYVTSNKEPMLWYPNAYEEHREALWRRLNKVILFKSNGEKQVIKDDTVV